MRKGMYDIILTFFIVAMLVFAVLLFLYLNASSAAVFTKVSGTSTAPRRAVEVKNAALACHRLEYFDEELMDAPCKAKNLLGGYRIRQHAINGCAEKVWDYTRLPPAQYPTIPFVVAVEQRGGKRCLATLDVVVPEVQQ